jgi:hypothetical protein
MNLEGLNVGKLKSLVIEKWSSAPELWPVKVLSMTRTLELEQKQGSGKLDAVGGYFTCLRAINGRTPAEMEQILGFVDGTFSSGVSVWRLEKLPAASDFELRGYTQTPGGETFDGIVLRRSDQHRPQYLTSDGTPVKFPPGGGVEQWELRPTFLAPAKELARVPAGARFVRQA